MRRVVKMARVWRYKPNADLHGRQQMMRDDGATVHGHSRKRPCLRIAPIYSSLDLCDYQQDRGRRNSPILQHEKRMSNAVSSNPLRIRRVSKHGNKADLPLSSTPLLAARSGAARGGACYWTTHNCTAVLSDAAWRLITADAPDRYLYSTLIC